MIGRRRSTVLGAVSAFLLMGAMSSAARADNDVLLPVPHQLFDVGTPGASDATRGGSPGQVRNLTGFICTATGFDGRNRRTDCEGTNPHNEPAIAVNPTNADNIISGANDYQLVTTGGHVYETILSRAHVSTDGGHTWSDYGVPWF